MLIEDVSKTTIELLSRAGLEASLVHHEGVGPEHLLLGILTKVDSPASRVLHDVGMSSERARPIVKKQNLPHLALPVKEALTVPARAVMNMAVELAQQGSTTNHLARPGHVLVALIISQDPHVMEVFTKLDIDPEAVHLAITDEVIKEES